MSGFIVPVSVVSGASTQESNANIQSAYGEAMVAQVIPEIQIIFTKGIPTTAETFEFSAGTVTEANSAVVCTSGTNAFGTALVRSKQWLPYFAGVGNMCRFSAQFSSPAALALQQGGFGNIENAMRIGYNGTEFGTLVRTGGLVEIVTLVITTHSNNGTISFDLDGVTYSILTPGTSEVANAQAIAGDAQFGTGEAYIAEYFTDLLGNVGVIFNATSIGVKTAPDNLSMGVGVGVLTQVRVGAADQDTFVAQANWNIDPMDGTGASGITLDPTKRNIYQIRYQWLGFGRTTFSMSDPLTGVFKDFHYETLVNTTATPVQPIVINPSMQLELFAANRGNTSSHVVYGSSMMGASQGEVLNNGVKFSVVGSGGSQNAVDGDVPILAILIKRVHQNKLNYTTNRALRVSCVMESGNNERGIIRLHELPTLTGASWQELNTDSTALYDTSATAYTGGKEILAIPLAPRSAVTVDLTPYNINWIRGECLLLSAEALSNGLTFTATLAWEEI